MLIFNSPTPSVFPFVEASSAHTLCNSSNWGQKSRTRVSYWWRWIPLFGHVFNVKDKRSHSPTIHSPTWKLKQNKCTRKCSKKEKTPRKWWFKSNQFKRIHALNSICLASDPQRKTPVSHTGQLEKDWIRARLEVPPAQSTRKRLVREAKFNLKYYTGWNAKSYIYTLLIWFS